MRAVVPPTFLIASSALPPTSQDVLLSTGTTPRVSCSAASNPSPTTSSASTLRATACLSRITTKDFALQSPSPPSAPASAQFFPGRRIRRNLAPAACLPS